jgi:putative resolvase
VETSGKQCTHSKTQFSHWSTCFFPSIVLLFVFPRLTRQSFFVGSQSQRRREGTNPNRRARMTGAPVWISAYRASAATGVTARTLRNWEARGLVKTKRTPTGQRVYDLASLPGGFAEPSAAAAAAPDSNAREPGEYLIYARVSSNKHKVDLERQVESLREKFPQHRIIRDVGSGINWKRPGLRTVVQCCLRGTLRELVVAHRDQCPSRARAA